MGIILKSAITNFLNRKRTDYRLWKKYSDDEIEKRRRDLPIRPPIWSALMHHPKVCFLIGARERYFAYHCDMGETTRCLVLVPRNASRAEWVRQIRKHTPGLTYTSLTGSSVNKWEQLEADDSRIVVCSYLGLLHMVSTRVPTKKGKEKLKWNPKLLKRLQKQVDGLILDEPMLVLTRRSAATFRLMRAMRKTASFLFELTGTPFGDDPTTLWTQLYLVDQGRTLGETLGLFRGAFFNAKDGYWGGQEFTFKKSMTGELHRVIANCTIRYATRESDLPRKVMLKRVVTLPADARAYYNKMRELVLAAHGNYTEMNNGFIRMRQISSGFLGYKDDAAGVRAEFEFTPNPKLDACMAMIEEIVPAHKVVVFHDFIFSGSMICRELRDAKIEHARLYGKTKDPAEELRRFTEDDDCRVLVVNSATGGVSLNLQIAPYGIYYESPVGVIMRKQTEKRMHRQGSEFDKVILYDLVAANTADQQILDAIAAGYNLFDKVIEGKVKLK
jgi:hypothetical protein